MGGVSERLPWPVVLLTAARRERARWRPEARAAARAASRVASDDLFASGARLRRKAGTAPRTGKRACGACRHRWDLPPHSAAVRRPLSYLAQPRGAAPQRTTGGLCPIPLHSRRMYPSAALPTRNSSWPRSCACLVRSGRQAAWVQGRRESSLFSEVRRLGLELELASVVSNHADLGVVEPVLGLALDFRCQLHVRAGGPL